MYGFICSKDRRLIIPSLKSLFIRMFIRIFVYMFGIPPTDSFLEVFEGAFYPWKGNLQLCIKM